MSAAMQIAERVHSLAQEQNDSGVMIGAYRVLAVTFYSLGDFETALQYATRGVQIWRLGGVQSVIEEIMSPVVICLCYEALSRWHLGEIAASQAAITEAISLAKKLNDMVGLAGALHFSAYIAHYNLNAMEVERVSSDLIELSTRQNFGSWLARGKVLRGWARSASGDTAEGISWILDGIDDWRAAGSMLMVPYLVALKAEALYLAERTSEALKAIWEAEALAKEREERWWFAELHRLRGVFLTALGAD